MKWFKFSLRLVALAATVLLVGSLAAQKTAAQYPPATGSASMSVSSTTPATGSPISVAVNVVNQLGIYVSGVPCTFQVLSQPGSDAVVDAGPKVTDVNGTAVSTLNVGTTPGTIVVGANCGELSSQVAVQAVGPAPAVTVRMPSTGTGPTESQPYGTGLVAALLIGGLATLGVGSVLLVAGRRVRSS